MVERNNQLKKIFIGNITRFKNLSLYLFASILSGIIGIAFNPFLAANLSSLDYSIIGYFSSFSTLFTPILNFSIISFYVRKYFNIDETKRQEYLDTIITILLLWGVVSSTLIIVFFFIYCKINNVQLPFFPFALLSIAQFFFNNFLLLYQVNCRMRSDAKRYFYITLWGSFLTVFLSLFLVIIFKLGAFGRLTAGLTSSLIIAYFAIKKTLFKLRLNYKILKEVISFGWPISVSYIIQYFLLGVDFTLLEPLNDNFEMGLYVVAISITGYFSIIYTALSQTFEPDLYKAVTLHNYKKIFRIISVIISILIPLLIVYILFANPIISLLTFNRYTDSFIYARIIALSVLTTYLMLSIENIINAFGYTKIALFNKLASSVIAVYFYFYLISEYQFMGAAWGRVISPLIVFIISIISILFIKPRILEQNDAEKT